jgi:protein transport protein SEC24
MDHLFFRLHDVNEGMTELPELDNSESEKLRTFVQWLNGQKPFPAPIKIIR